MEQLKDDNIELNKENTFLKEQNKKSQNEIKLLKNKNKELFNSLNKYKSEQEKYIATSWSGMYLLINVICKWVA